MNNNSKDNNFEQQQCLEQANSKVTELEALRFELHQLKEEIKNKQQIRSRDISTGVAYGIIKAFGTLALLYFALVFIVMSGLSYDTIGKPRESPFFTFQKHSTEP
jgi:hypothetical protein